MLHDHTNHRETVPYKEESDSVVSTLKVEFEGPRQQRALTASLEPGHPKNLLEVIENV